MAVDNSTTGHPDQSTVSMQSHQLPVILVHRDAETSDNAALESAAGLLTQCGARSSHAAVVARQLGKVSLAGCTELQIDDAARSIQIGNTALHEGELISLDGNEGAFLCWRCSGGDQVSGGAPRTCGRSPAARPKDLIGGR